MTLFMKKTILLLLFFMVVFFASAQRYGKDIYKPMGGAKGFSIALESPNPMNWEFTKPRALIILKYMLQDNIGLRLGASYYYYQFKYKGDVIPDAYYETFKGDTTSL